MPLSIYGAQFLLDFLFSKASNVPATTLYLGLFITTPSDTGGGEEVSAGGYTRLAIANNNTSWAGATGTFPSIKGNAINFVFPTSTADWGTVGFWGIFDASSGGNLIWWGTLATAVDVPTGSNYTFNTGNFLLTLG